MWERADTCPMDEPTHVQESLFWDQVAEWLLDSHALVVGPAAWAPVTMFAPGSLVGNKLPTLRAANLPGKDQGRNQRSTGGDQ